MKSRSFISKGAISAVVAVSALIAAACSSMFEDKDFALASFSFDGCISTKAPEGNYTVEKAKAGTLHLQSKNGNLKITLSGLTDNCSIKEGYDCRAIKEGLKMTNTLSSTTISHPRRTSPRRSCSSILPFSTGKWISSVRCICWKLLSLKVLEPEFAVGGGGVSALIAAVAVHSVRIDHQFESLALPLEFVHET